MLCFTITTNRENSKMCWKHEKCLFYITWNIELRDLKFFFSRYFLYFSLTLTNRYLHWVIMQPRKLFKPLVLARAISPTLVLGLKWSIWKLSDRRNIGWWLTTLRWWCFNWIWWERLVTFFYLNHICYFMISHFSSLSSQTLQQNTKFFF